MPTFKERLKQKQPLIGTLLSLGHPCVAEMVSRCGYDWLWIDMEHSPLSLDQVQGLLQAKEKECSAFVRTPVNDEIWIKRILDIGADGIIVPQVKTFEEAKYAVASSKYPPVGTRSAGVARANSYGMDFSYYSKEANDMLVVLLQIEHRDGVRNINEILKVPGVDGIIIGPYDLSGSFGKLGQIDDAEVQTAIQIVHEACNKQGMPIGIFALLPEHGKKYLRLGYQLVSLGIDAHFLWTAAKAGLENMLQD